VALLGDAAHPMLPSMAQGAVQSIEDAYILAQSLASSSPSHIPTACKNYFQNRIRRTTKVQKVSMKNLNLFHKSNAWAQFVHYAPIWFAGHFTPILIQKRYDWLYGKGFGPLAPRSLN
jgi:salicylate hydroxylase